MEYEVYAPLWQYDNVYVEGKPNPGHWGDVVLIAAYRSHLDLDAFLRRSYVDDGIRNVPRPLYRDSQAMELYERC